MKLHFNGLSTKQLLRKACSFRRGAVKIPGLWLNIKMVPEVTNSTEIKPWWKKKKRVFVCLETSINIIPALMSHQQDLKRGRHLPSISKVRYRRALCVFSAYISSSWMFL